MKRTIEIVLSVIGAALSVLMSVLGIAILYLKEDEINNQNLNDNWSQSQADKLRDMMSHAGTTWVLPGVIGIALGVIAIILLAGNRRPKLAGWLLLIAAAAVAILSRTIGSLQALLFLIVGIMALVRKAR